eukprot:COSAG04_NODE_782_length_10326_cov_9.216095_6_plen_320_part_00
MEFFATESLLKLLPAPFVAAALGGGLAVEELVAQTLGHVRASLASGAAQALLRRVEDARGGLPREGTREEWRSLALALAGLGGVGPAAAAGLVCRAAEGDTGDEGRGRCLRASAPLSVGDVVLEDRPLAAAIRRERDGDGLAPPPCHWCGAAVGVAAVRCPGCTDALYCGSRCLAEAFVTEHQAECGVDPLPLLLPAETTLARRVRRRCLADPAARATVQALEGHESALQADAALGHALQAAVAAVLEDGEAANGGAAVQTTCAELFSHLCRIDSNAHAITDVVAAGEDGTAVSREAEVRLAVALYPVRKWRKRFELGF